MTTMSTSINLQAVRTVLSTRRMHWVGPTVIMTFMALVYAAFLYQPEWVAQQSLALRDEAANGLSRDGRPGRFDGLDSLKVAQETVIELAGSRAVVAAALRDVGPPENHRSPETWPSQRDVEKLQAKLTVKAPHGVELGKTEVFYLAVSDKNRERALALAAALADGLENQLQVVRNHKSESLVKELTQTAELTQADLNAATERLAKLERSVGSDLVELRMLSDNVSGESNLRMSLIAAKNDLRQARLARKGHEQLLALLQAAQSDPTRLLATPNHLLTSQPALQQLKHGLIEAQLATARLRGTMSESHPVVQTSLGAESAIRNDLHREIALAVRGIEADLELNQGSLDTLNEQIADLNDRMARLAGMRATYVNAAAMVHHATESVKKANQDLASARSNAAAAQTTSLVTRIENPYTAHDPKGPRKAFIVLAGLLGGLAAGLGFVFVTEPAPAQRSDSTASVGALRTARNCNSAPAAMSRVMATSPDSAPSEPICDLTLKQALERLAFQRILTTNRFRS